MKFIDVERGYAHKRVTAEITKEESLLHEKVLVMMADGNSQEVAQRRFDNKEHPCHFGYRSFSLGDTGEKIILQVIIHTD
jgi:hypothetical protein